MRAIRDCYPCDGRGYLIKEWGQEYCHTCQGTGEAPNWELSTGADPAKRPKP
jgi:DnaJ-class molecular chaperone